MEKGRISGFQFTVLVMGFIQGSTLLLAFAIPITKHDTWLILLAGAAIMIPFSICYAALAQRFPGWNLIQMNRMIYGKYLGTLISTFYVYWIFNVFSFNVRTLGDFYTTFLMPETPLLFFLVGFTLVCAYAVWKGIEVMARIGPVLVAIILLNIISTFLLLVGSMDFSHFFPLFEAPFPKLIQGTHIIATIPFGEMVIFLAITPALKNPKVTKKYLLWGVTLGAISLLIIQIRNTATLGNTEFITTSPSFQASRLIDVERIFSRMDILVGIGQTVAIFLKCIIFYYATLVCLAQLLGLKNYLSLVLPVGGMAVILAATCWHSHAELLTDVSSAGPIFFTPFIFVIPPLSLLIAKLRNLPKQGAGEG
ncbi:MAG TPA: endospore germination permease [Bacillota bacterium]|nr:endospore germination permease [Bacillota bacterium]